MNATNSQIVTLYEVENLPPEVIAEELSWEVAAVKAILLQNSLAYRKATFPDKEGHSEEPDITEEEFAQIKTALKNIALYGEDEATRARVLKFLFDEKKGRNINPATVIAQAPKLNITIINAQLQRARAAISRAKEQPLLSEQSTSPAINV